MKKISLSLLILLFISSCGYPYSDGNRQGYIRKFSKKGFISKTWEGELVQQVQGVMVADTFDFTVSDENLAMQIQEALAKQKKVEITYKEKLYFFSLPQGDTNYFIQSIKYLD